jgi:hypothetical protein
MKAGIAWLLNVFGDKKARQLTMDYRDFVAGDAGRRIMADLAQYCRVGHTSFVAGDPHQTAFNEGARDTFLHIAEMAGLEPNDFPQLMEERQDD